MLLFYGLFMSDIKQMMMMMMLPNCSDTYRPVLQATGARLGASRPALPQCLLRGLLG